MLTITDVFAQQDPLYTQYIDNLQIVNPGFAGSQGFGNVLLVSRNQWVSLSGAPVTRSFSYTTPTSEKVGIGFSVLYDKIGPQKQTGAYFDYSYFLRISEDFKMGMGLKGGVTFYRADLTGLSTIDPDPIYSRDIYKNFLPNLGVGLYAFSDNAYFGISIPKLIENVISRDDYETEYVNKEEIHIYAVAGKKFDLGPDFQLKTNGMLQVVKNSPILLQATLMGGFRERFWLGAMARFGDAFGIVAQFQATENMKIGYSYDITTSELNVFSNGTHEIMFGYSFNMFR
jgi:type IX secretion system PorP/SprF family membrane protein